MDLDDEFPRFAVDCCNHPDAASLSNFPLVGDVPPHCDVTEPGTRSSGLFWDDGLWDGRNLAAAHQLSKRLPRWLGVGYGNDAIFAALGPPALVVRHVGPQVDQVLGMHAVSDSPW